MDNRKCSLNDDTRAGGTLRLSNDGKKLYAQRKRSEGVATLPCAARSRVKYTPRPDSERAFALRIGVALIREHSFG